MLTQSLRHIFGESRIEVTGAFAAENIDKEHGRVVRPGGLELPTFWFVARRSIQLSYGRAVYVRGE